MDNYNSLKSAVAKRLQIPRVIKPQTQRKLETYLAEHGHEDNISRFLLAAPDLLEDYELEILFAPQFTPDMDDKLSVADSLYHWKPTTNQLDQLINELCQEQQTVPIIMDDLSEAKLTLHEVMTERFIKLLRVNNAPKPATSAAMRDALPAELWPHSMVEASQRGFTENHQTWFAHFINHICTSTTITKGLITEIAQFIASQSNLASEQIIDAADALLKAVRANASFAASGQTYWSADVAQHHQYRGEGTVNQDRVKQSQQEVEWIELLTQQLRSFDCPLH